jgi:imidazolonepropionase-like amidohydrolase
MRRAVAAPHSRVPFVVVVVFACAMAGCAPSESQQPAVTVFEGARVIVGGDGAPIDDAGFIVAGGRFTQVGRRSELQSPAGAMHVDLTGKTVRPTEAGLIRVGQRADFVVLDGEHIAAVYAGGVVASGDASH